MRTQTEILAKLQTTPDTLTDAELLACVLSKHPGPAALKAAGKLLAGCLTAERGAMYSSRLKAAELLGKRMASKGPRMFIKPKDIWDSLQDIRSAKKEYFIVFYLDTRNAEIKRETVSIGCLNANLVHPREVFEVAIRNLAASIIITHNHPSGCLEPSDEDTQLTKRLTQAGKLLGIEVLDHVIVSKTGFMSFKEKGLI
ncbi:MAG: DNA repair protein RadC [Patescibacteria group bacterium]